MKAVRLAAAGLALMYLVKLTRTLRISEAGEIEGLDIHEHGAPAYHPEPAYEGYSPIEVFGRSRFPRVGELPYLLTLAPRGFYWFQLVKDETE